MEKGKGDVLSEETRGVVEKLRKDALLYKNTNYVVFVLPEDLEKAIRTIDVLCELNNIFIDGILGTGGATLYARNIF